jgi:translation initiation factor IF-2
LKQPEIVSAAAHPSPEEVRVRVHSLLVTAIVVVAATSCSEAPAPDAAAENARSSTVLPAGDDARTPIASPEEANLPPEAPPTHREAAAAPARPLPAVAAGAPEAAGTAGEAAGAGRSDGAAESDAAQPQQAAAVGGGTGKPRPTMAEGPMPDPYNPGRPGIVIIRGGNPGIDDDCAIHPNVRDVGLIGAAGVGGGSLIGDILPAGGALINDRGPTPAAVGADPTARGGTVLNNPDPRRGSGVTGGIGMPARGGATPSRGGMPRRGIR